MATDRLTEQPLCFYIFLILYYLVVKLVDCEVLRRDSEATKTLDYHFDFFNILLHDIDDGDNNVFGLNSNYSAVLIGLWLISSYNSDDYFIQSMLSPMIGVYYIAHGCSYFGWSSGICLDRDHVVLPSDCHCLLVSSYGYCDLDTQICVYYFLFYMQYL